MSAEVIPIRRKKDDAWLRSPMTARYERSRNSLQWSAWHRRRVELFAQLEQAAHNLDLSAATLWQTRLEAHQLDRPPGFPEGAA